MKIQDRYPHANIPALRAWVAKLREPQRQQTNGQLAFRDADGTVRQCCLDVACEVYAETADSPQVESHWGDGRAAETGNAAATRWYRYADSEGETHLESSVLPPPVSEWFGFYRVDPNTGERATYSSGHQVSADDNPEFATITDLPESPAGSVHRKVDAGEIHSAATMNDAFGMNFAQIADVIEASLPPEEQS